MNKMLQAAYSEGKMESTGARPALLFSLHPLLGFSNASEDQLAPIPPGGHSENGILLLQDGEKKNQEVL